jgi:outer membrane lipoprotein SlyB
MRQATRFVSAASSLFVLLGLVACGSVPMDSQAPYPASQYPNQNPYPAQSQYPSQYPAQSQYPGQNQQGVEYGRVTNVEVFQNQQQGQGTGLGAVLGGVAGAVVGHQIGGGTGKDVATVAGAVGGAVAGNAIEKNRNAGVRQTYRVSVQLERGGVQAYDLPSSGDLRVGERVRIENGQLFRN